jgi:hypothetical protein
MVAANEHYAFYITKIFVEIADSETNFTDSILSFTLEGDYLT